MTALNPIPGNAPGLPAVMAMPTATLDEIRDLLTLALDQIETGQLDPRGMAEAVAYQRQALQLSYQLEGIQA